MDTDNREVMTRENAGWDEFHFWLAMTLWNDGETCRCSGTHETAIWALRKVNADIARSLAWFSRQRAFCDCEIGRLQSGEPGIHGKDDYYHYPCADNGN